MTGNQIAYWKYAEDVRRNAEAESQGRTNLAEVRRHNLATEGLQDRQIGLGYAQLGLGYSQLAETRRANSARELLQSKELAETTRINTVRAVETERANKAKEEEATRSNKAREEETNRHNKQLEDIAAAEHNFNVGYKTGVETWLRAGEAFGNLIGSGFKIATIGR